MKRSVSAYYNAYSGVYHERRLPKSTQFVAGVYVLVIGLSVLLVGQGMRAHWGRPVSVKAVPQTRLVAHTDSTPVVAGPIQVPAPTAASSLETNQISSAVQAIISKPPAAAWSIAIYDVDAHNWLYRNNATDQMQSASLYKLYAAYGLSKKLPFHQWAGTPIAGKDVQTCVDLMIRMSDNACGDAIGNYVGWKAIDTSVHAAGYTNTMLNSTAGPLTTAEDTSRFMTELYEGKLFDAETTTFLKTSLQKQLYRSAIPAGCTGCQTYNKTGNENGVTHDTAIVISGGRTYAVTIMSEGGTYGKLAAVERAIQTAITASTP
jgi:beta-lactamase class A